MPVGFRYSRWDGTQAGFEVDADDVLSEITDDLLYHGDLNAALRRMMQSGFRDQNGERLAGMRELMERLRRRRKDELEKYDLGGVYDDIARELREVVELAGSETPAAVASAVEFVLEGLHLSKRLNKDAVGTKATYRGRG